VTKRQVGPLSDRPSAVTIRAPAKVNLILRILDRRPDGYHNLWSIMQTVGLEDELRIKLSPHAGEIRLTCNTQTLAVDRSNLVYKAASAVLDRTQQSVGLDIELHKRIPMGAGLGGGSSDAAATIVGLNHLLHLGWSRDQLAEVTRPLGSDVPFFLFAPSAVVTGRGETVKRITIEGRRWVLLVKPGFSVETKWAYQELATTRGAVRPLAADHAELDQHELMSWSQLAAMAENDFEEPVFSGHAVLREIKQILRAQGAELALLSGSGATVFGLFHDESAARHAQTQFARDKQLNVFVVSTCSEPLAVSSPLGV
jgi:4-diphosphocytidyl-2-C-methyl-D-erythritol kinase